MTPAEPIRVLVVDDAPLLRRLLAAEIARASDMSAVACGSAIADVREQLLRQHPDVILLNLGVQLTDPLILLRKLRAHYPVPILVQADRRTAREETVMRALELGAFEVITIPEGSRHSDLSRYAADLLPRIRGAARGARPVRPFPSVHARLEPFTSAGIDPRRYVIAVGASTGGPEAVRELLASMSADAPPIVIVQHMPAGFTRSFAERLNASCALRVTEAVDGEPLRPGCALVARGDTHLTIRRAGDGWLARYTDQQLVSGHCPSVNVLFESVATAKRNAIAVLLTGMGADGATGLLRIREAGGLTLAQDRASCVVYGMPKVAADLGAAAIVAPPQDIPAKIVAALRTQRDAVSTGPPRRVGSWK